MMVNHQQIPTTFCVCVTAFATPTTSALAGEINATQSFLAFAISITTVVCVASETSAFVCEGL